MKDLRMNKLISSTNRLLRLLCVNNQRLKKKIKIRLIRYEYAASYYYLLLYCVLQLLSASVVGCVIYLILLFILTCQSVIFGLIIGEMFNQIAKNIFFSAIRLILIVPVVCIYCIMLVFKEYCSIVMNIYFQKK
jgi:hypothetical protein